MIVLGLIAARSFGDAQPIDLHKPESVKEQWKLIFEACYDLLAEFGLVSGLPKADLFGKTGNEHPVSNLVRHTDELRRKTGGVFKAHGNQLYSLDVASNGKILTERLAFLLKLVIDTELDSGTIGQVFDLCRKVAYDQCILIFDVAKNPYLGTIQDEQIRQSLLQAFAPI